MNAPMIRIRRASDRGHADHGWLETFHTFSFAEYFDHKHMGFGSLRVLNQDRIHAGRGFAAHDHENMEIVTVLQQGILEHTDSTGTASRMVPGDVQLMSAGTGIRHSEANASSTESLELLQMWIMPRELGTSPRYEQRNFGLDPCDENLQLVASPDGAKNSLTIGQDACLFMGRLATDQMLRHRMTPGTILWVHLARGHMKLNGKLLGPGDGAAVRDERDLEFRATDPVEFVAWELSDQDQH